MDRVTPIACIALGSIAAACTGGGGSARASAQLAAPARIDGVRRLELSAPGVTGLSDLTVDGSGRWWAVAERKRIALRIDGPGAAPVVVPLHGVPDGLDTEGVAWLAGDRLVLATESNDPLRDADRLLFAHLGPDGITVDEQRLLEYRIWPLRPVGNEGIEGVCAAGGFLVAAVETVVARGGARYAPIARFEVATGRWTPLLARLTTPTGKISALSCVARADGFDVLAIERHFEIARLIRFLVPRGAAAGHAPLEPVLVADLRPLLWHSENYEGLIWDGDHRFAMVVDNDWQTISGPNLLVTAHLSGALPEPARPR